MENDSSHDTRPPYVRGWSWRFAVAFIVLTLLALVYVPWAVQRRVNALRAEIEASEPIRTLIIQWQFHLVREMGALGELLLSGDSTQTSAYGTAWAAERAIYEDVAPLVDEMGPQVVARFAEARALASQWHARVDHEELLRERTAGAPLLEIPRERQLFEDVIRAIARVDRAVVQETARTRAEIMAAERAGLTWTLVLGMLALIAGAAVIGLQTRLRRFAEEAGRRRAQADEALAETARAGELRNRLLRGITHDVKNPLGAARGYAELLAMGIKAPLAPAQAPLVEGIERSIDSALAIIADLLDLARVDSRGFTLHRVPVDLNDLIREAVQDYRATADTSGHELQAETASEPLMVHTDPVRVRQVLDNLLSNAIKYTPAPGRIVARAALVNGAAVPKPGTWVVIEVSDTGPGIPPEQREAIFDEFTRLHDGSPVQGHGLGLAIARGLSRRLGGDLTLADRGPGATFVLWIPQRDEEGDATEIPSDA